MHFARIAIFLIAVMTFSFTVGEGKDYSYYFPEVKGVVPEYRSLEQRPRIALVLGAGGARGMAHVGILKEFEEAGITIDMITGCSAGAIVGALYAHTPSADLIKKELAQLTIFDVTDYSFFLGYKGLCSGESLQKFLLKHIATTYFEELSIPLTAVATNLKDGTLVKINSGPVAPAIHASGAYPFLFDPVKIYGTSYVDGGVLNPIPVDIAQDEGADIIIAVDLSHNLPESLPTNPFGVLKRCYEIQCEEQRQHCLSGADFVIDFDLNHVSTFDASQSEKIYLIARQAAREAIPKIQKLIAQKNRTDTSSR